MHLCVTQTRLFLDSVGSVISSCPLPRAIALQNPQDAAVKKSAKRAITMLRGITADLPFNTDLVAICNQLPDLIGKIF